MKKHTKTNNYILLTENIKFCSLMARIIIKNKQLLCTS